MYMFFWFFKQFYYCLRRIFKSGILLLIVFFIAFLFIFVKPSFAANITLQSNVPGNSNTYILPSLDTLPIDAANLINIGKPYIIRKFTDSGSTTYNLYIINSDNGYFYHDSNHSASLIHNVGPIYGCKYTEGTSYQWRNSAGIASSLELNNVIYYGGIIYGDINKNTIYFNPFIEPYIVTSSASIINWSFDNLIINCGDCNPSSTFYLDGNYEGYTFTFNDINRFKTIVNNKAILTIPKSFLNESIVLRNGFTFSFNLQVRQPDMQVLYYELGSYVLQLTSEEQEQINQDSNKQLLSDINKGQQQTTQAINNLNNSQQETTNAVNDLNNTVSDSTVDDSSIFLPSLNVNDPTQVGINNIFNLLYNAFTAGDATDIVLPFPFTNKSITIPGNLTYNVLHNNGGDALIHIIHIFWRYQIFSFIVYDIHQKMKLIQEGNIEEVQKDNIKGEML